MTAEVQEIAFDREVAEVPVAPSGGAALPAGNPILRNMTLARRATIVAGAVVIAGGSYLAGLGVGGALCVFIGLLPVLFVMSVLVGVSAAVNTAAKVVREGGPPPDGMTLVRRQQRVRLRATADALELELQQDGASSQIERWAWAEVTLQRTADALELAKPPRAMVVPLSTSGLEAFAAAVERHISAATPPAR